MPAANARALAEYLSAIRADTLHLVGHSLGGLVILKLFEEHAQALARLPPGRIVLLGSPLRGSRTARNLARLPFGKKIMGLGVGEELLVPRERRWRQSRDLGVIAGDLGVGLGRLVGPLGGASDGTILVEETQIEGAADRVVLRVSHTGMLFSAAVARAAARLPEHGAVCAELLGAAVQLLQAEQQIQGFARTQGIRVEGAQGFEGGGLRWRRWGGAARGGENRASSPCGEVEVRSASRSRSSSVR